MEDEDGNDLFTLLPYFFLDILALPTSNVDAERIFSKVGARHRFLNCELLTCGCILQLFSFSQAVLMKSTLHNKLLPSSQAALVHVCEAVKDSGGCENVQI